MMLHNLYAGASSGSRTLLRWSVIGLVGIFAYDLNLGTIAYLGGDDPAVLTGLRGLFTGVMAALFALGMNPVGPRVQFSPSRAVTFRTLSLLLIGSYLVLMVLAAKSLALIGGDVARTSQLVFVLLAVVAVALAVPSPRLRGWLRVTGPSTCSSTAMTTARNGCGLPEPSAAAVLAAPALKNARSRPWRI